MYILECALALLLLLLLHILGHSTSSTINQTIKQSSKSFLNSRASIPPNTILILGHETDPHLTLMELLWRESILVHTGMLAGNEVPWRQ